MSRKPKITAVPVEQPDLNPAAEEEGKTDAEQITDIIKEVQEEPRQTQEEPKEAVSDAPVVAKAKTKRASRAQPNEVLTLPGVDQREPKGEDKVGCSDCGKQMSAKTLKHSHGPNCSSKKPKTKADKKDERQPTIQREEITEELIEHHIRTRTRADRALRRETMMNKLMQTAF